MSEATIFDNFFPLAKPAERSESDAVDQNHVITEFRRTFPELRADGQAGKFESGLKTIQYESKDTVAIWNGLLKEGVDDEDSDLPGLDVLKPYRERRAFSIDIITPTVLPILEDGLKTHHSERIVAPADSEGSPALSPRDSTFPLLKKNPGIGLRGYMPRQGIDIGKSLEKPVPTLEPPPSKTSSSSRGPIYLEFGNSTMSNHDLNSIKLKTWIEDSVIDVSFEQMELITACKEHKITLLTSMTARKLLEIGDLEEQQTTDYNPPDYIKYYRAEVPKLLKHNDFIFIPINDGYGTEDNPLAGKSPIAGTHWTLVVIHCTKPATNKEEGIYAVRFFDSEAGGEDSKSFWVAQKVIKGVRRVFECQSLRAQNLQMVATDIEPNCPNQRLHIRNEADSSGACGPFIWALANDMVRYLIFSLKAGVPSNALRIDLPEQFPDKFPFDSDNWRKTIENLLSRERRMRITKTGVVAKTEWPDTRHLYPSFSRADGMYRKFPTPRKPGSDSDIPPIVPV